MPVTKSAKKKLRKDKKREVKNQQVENKLKSFIKLAKKNPSEEAVKSAVRIADKAAKKNIIHKNKAARIKSFLAKLIGHKPAIKKQK